MADVPLPFGLVVAALSAAVGDTADTGLAPDAEPLVGKAIFSGNQARFVAGQTIFVPQKITADVVGGVLQYNGTAGVPLTANVDSGGNSLGWQWSVTWQLTRADGTTPVVLTGWSFDVRPYTAGDISTETDLSDFTPLLPSAGSQVFVKGDGVAPGGTTGQTLVKASNTDYDTEWADSAAPVTSVNSKTGAVVLSASDVGASPTGAYVKPGTGIPKTDMASAVQTSLGKADSAVQPAGLTPYAPLASPAFTGSPTAPTPSAGDVSTRLATTASLAAVATVRTNLCTNPNIETNTAGWNLIGNSTVGRTTAEHHSGSAALVVTTAGAAPAEGASWVGSASRMPGKPFSGGLWIKAPAGATLYIAMRTVGASSQDVITNFTGTGAWQWVEADSNVAQSDATSMQLMIRTATTATAQALTFYIDDAHVEQATSIAYQFDGSKASDDYLYAWTGPVNGSTSIAMSTLSSAVLKSILTAKGDLIAATAAGAPVRVPVGAAGQVLTADAAQPSGIKWATPSGSAAPNWFSNIWSHPGVPVNVGTSNESRSAGTLYLDPMFLTAAGTLTGISHSVATAAAAGNSARVGLYALVSGVWTLVGDAGTVAIDSTGDKTVAGLSYAAPAGWVATAFLPQATVTLKVRYSSQLSPVGPQSNSPWGQSATTFQATQAYGALPSTVSPSASGGFSQGTFAHSVVTLS